MNNIQFSDPDWLKENGFSALSQIATLLDTDENQGRDALIRLLEHRESISQYAPIVSALVQRAGLYPYLRAGDKISSTADLLNIEYHAPEGLEDIVLHAAQAKVYRALMDRANVILSAPTSFGKSLLIDAIIASGEFAEIVVIVPTIALIDETRRRLSRRFGREFKVITHPSQQRSGRNIFVLTQERFVEFEKPIKPQFFILDEFYKLSPNRGDERTFVLNQAFYHLFKSGAQFFLIGPNVRDISIDETDLNFRFFRFDFTTVATEVRYSQGGDELENALEICATLDASTLIFCKSAASAYELGAALVAANVTAPTLEAGEMANWLRANYHPSWDMPALLEHGIGVHHGSLPRSIAYHLLRKFNDGAIRFLLCTSTIIEGVNTSAKNIVIYDNKIATRKFDQFTFNNIKGRAGRMFRHFVGHVYVLHPAPDPELPIVDIPSITQGPGVPESLLIQLDQRDLSERSIEQLRYLHAQDYLPMEVLRLNTGIDPGKQVDLAANIAADPHTYHSLLAWRGFPNGSQLYKVCELIFESFLDGKPKDGVASGKQLAYMIFEFYNAKSIGGLIEKQLAKPYPPDATPTETIEGVFKFLRQWCEFHFPRYLTALDRIQHSVFNRSGLEPGDYSMFAATVKQQFMHPAVTILEEYGLPNRVTQEILKHYDVGLTVDDILASLQHVNVAKLKISKFEAEMLADTIQNI
jgi:hypothetical protein